MQIQIVKDNEPICEKNPISLKTNQIVECKLITKGWFTSTFDIDNQMVCIRNWNFKSKFTQ